MSSLNALKKTYENYLEKSEGKDPDFPDLIFGEQGTKINSGKNIYSFVQDGKTLEDFKKENNLEIIDPEEKESSKKLAPDEERRLLRQARLGSNHLK